VWDCQITSLPGCLCQALGERVCEIRRLTGRRPVYPVHVLAAQIAHLQLCGRSNHPAMDSWLRTNSRKNVWGSNGAACTCTGNASQLHPFRQLIESQQAQLAGGLWRTDRTLWSKGPCHAAQQMNSIWACKLEGNVLHLEKDGLAWVKLHCLI